MWTRVLSLLSFFVILQGCGSSQTSTSNTNYISWSASSVRASLIADARKDMLNVCIEGTVTPEILVRAKKWAMRSIWTWFRALKVLDERVDGDITFTCANRDMTIKLRNGSGTSFASPSTTTIYTSRPYGTWTHEFGHALAGLSDTYAGGAGSCKSGQPKSLMCWGAYGPRADPEAFSTLWPDDLEGIQANYAMLFGREMTPPEWGSDIDLEAPLDLQNPWPGKTGETFGSDSDLDVILVDELINVESGTAIDL